MNPIERQMALGRELMEINTQWFKKIAEFDASNFQKYVEMNQEFAGRIPEINDMQSFADLQREYGEALWSATQSAFQERGEMLREAAEANGAAVKSAFSPESANAEETDTKPEGKTTKASTKAA
jgi:hypothetical protein